MSYRIVCQHAGCANEARYKVAAEWSDSEFQELKTYALACPEHLEELYRDARRRGGEYVLAEGESLGAPGIYELPSEGRVSSLVRRRELEEQYGG